jgi:hypothetical protein
MAQGRRQEQRLEKNPRYYARNAQPRFHDTRYKDPDYVDDAGRIYVLDSKTGERFRLWVKLPRKDVPWLDHALMPGGSRQLSLTAQKEGLPNLQRCTLVFGDKGAPAFRTGQVIVERGIL